MDNVNHEPMHLARVRDSLAQLNLLGELHDDGNVIHVKLDSGRTFEVSHVFVHMANKKVLDTRLRYGAAMLTEDRHG